MKNVNEQFVDIAKTNVETMVDLGSAALRSLLSSSLKSPKAQ
jgi:hypothetical protein